jgi:ABC-type uncharacterized transport system involved in gliding motility auxiliary subunit
MHIRDWPLMLKLVLATALYLLLNQIVQMALPSVRLDLSEKRQYSLTEGSRSIIASVKERTELTLYYSEKEARPYPQFRQYAQRVLEKVSEYAAQSGGKIRLRTLDPEPYSANEDAAINHGITAIPLEDGSGPLYFGLNAQTGTRTQAIAFIKPEAEPNLEYELSKLIQAVQRGDKPKLLLVTDLAVSGNNNPAFGPISPAWVAYRQLSERYQVSHIAPQALQSLPETDVLWVMHPRGWPPAALAQIQRFIEQGGHAVIMLDPNVESVPVFSVNNPTLSNLYLGSEPGGLLAAWGIEFNANQVVLDSKYAWLMQLDNNQFPKRNPALISLPAEAMNQRDVISAGLDRVVLSSAGALSLADQSPLRIQPLLQSSDSSRLLSAESFRMTSEDPEKLLNGFVSSQEPFVLAARFFSEPDTKAKSKAKASKPMNFVVIADTDFLSDRLWVQENNLFGEAVFSAQASNGDFFFNVIDHLSGSDDLISIRSRGLVSRPFEKVDQLRRSAEQRYRDSQTGLLLKLEDVQKRLNALERQSVVQGRALKDSQTALTAEKVSLRKALRRIQHDLNRDVERLGHWLKAINIIGMPLLLLAVAGLLQRRRRLRRDFSRINHGSP